MMSSLKMREAYWHVQTLSFNKKIPLILTHEDAGEVLPRGDYRAARCKVVATFFAQRRSLRLTPVVRRFLVTRIDVNA